MKIKVTKKMVKALNDYAKEHNYNMTFSYNETGFDTYRWYVDYNVFNAYDWGDYDMAKNVFKYIAVKYPYECYAMDTYLTTELLNKLFKSGMDYDKYMNEVMQEVAI